jgi:hypothetical protein
MRRCGMVEEGREGWKGRKGLWDPGRGLLLPCTVERISLNISEVQRRL